MYPLFLSYPSLMYPLFNLEFLLILFVYSAIILLINYFMYFSTETFENAFLVKYITFNYI